MWRVAGVDEAGRGPLAGPVVAAAVILNTDRPIAGLADSKCLSPRVRERLAEVILREALSCGIGWADPMEIDELNILQATFLAMRRAVLSLCIPADLLLVDGNRLPALGGFGRPVEGLSLVRGDATEAAISAASIVAKTARDAYMNHMDTIYPEYDFARHKGYPTPAHLQLLGRHGPCQLHRRSFAPVRRVCEGVT